MKRIVLISLATVLIAGCNREEKESGPGDSPSASSRVHHAENGETIITLDPAAQKKIGLELKTVEVRQIDSEVKGPGQVVDPAVLAQAAGDFTTARAASEASQAELKRLRTLVQQDNASDRALQAAEAAAARDQAQLDVARSKLLAGWGQVIAGHADLPAFLRSLQSLETALVRIDLPAGEILPVPPGEARLVTLSGEQHPARFVDVLPAVDSATQSRGILFLVPESPTNLVPGAAVTGYLRTSGTALTGFVIPRSAIIRHEGVEWIYLQSNETNFIRRRIVPDRPWEDGWFITEGVAAGDRIVSGGAQTVFSEELNAGGFLSGERD